MSVTAARGFEAGGIACGIKPSGAPDLALIATADRHPVSAAAVFTTNIVSAAPVQISRDHVRDGRAAAVVLNSGNANAATGEPGRRDARRMCELTAESLGCAPDDVLVCSTGLIGLPLPLEALDSGIPKLAGTLQHGDEAARAAAEAILTTDTVRKEAAVPVDLADGTIVRVGGMAKGAAMLAPALATMLAVITTDAAVQPRVLHQVLEDAVDGSFNQLLIDGSTSTNDTVLLLASGEAGNPAIGSMHSHRADHHALREGVTNVCAELALQMARDAEGATKQVQVVVSGALSSSDARQAARAVAGSQLVQCSLNGSDPYWGRIISELGASGVPLAANSIDIAYNGVVVCRDSVAAAHDPHELAAAMAGRDIEIRCDLKLGMGEARVLTTDLSHAYIDENRRTS
jgi:glutamate N-acetyltransferase / amino-acid N-acetyltransferase